MTNEEAKLVLDSLSTWVGQERIITEEIVEAIKVLSIPSLPSNMDEAAEAIAEKYATKVFGKVDTHDHIDHNGKNECRALYSIGCIEGFKAGVEWMTGQGVSYIDRLVVIDDEIYLNCSPDTVDLSLFQNSKEVIVQIRKK